MPAPAPAPPIRPGWLVLGWLVGVLACAGRMLAAQARVWRLTRRCPPLPTPLLSSIGPETASFSALLTGPAGTPPMVWGWPRAVLLLPPEAADWPDARRRAVVLHEAAHIRRCDWLTHLLAQATCALYWFNPLIWLLAARLGAEAERACDDAVLLAGVPPTDYAQDLLAVARHLGAGRLVHQASLGAVTMARRSPVRGRLEAILDTCRPRRRITRRAAALALAVALAVATPLAALRPAVRADEAQVGQAAPTAGVPTEADIAKVQRHLQGLEEEKADYTAAHPNTLSLTQIGYLDGLRQETESKRTMQRLVARELAEEKDPNKRAKVLRVLKEHDAWATQSGRNYRALVKSRVAGLPAAQVTREARIHDLDEAVALDKTRVEMMQMEHSLGYPLHIRPDSLAVIAHTALYWEKTGQMSRADSVHVSLLQQKMGQQKRLDDTDIDSLIVILHKPSIAPNVNLSDVMQLFGMLPHSSTAQQQQMREAITPLLKSRSHWERDQAEQTLKKLGEAAPMPPPAQKAQAAPAVIHPVRPQPTPQPAKTGVSPMTPLTHMTATLLKTAAFATLTTGLMLPVAHAAPPVPASKPEAPKPAAQASVAQVPAAGASHWASFLLRHTPLWKIRAFTGWDRGETLPEGVIGVYFLESNRSVLVRATPAGITHMQGIISRLDASLRPIQIRVAFATVTAADLNASGLHSDAVPLGGPGAAGKSPQLFMEGAEGSAVTALLASLEKRKAALVVPTITTDINVPATISMEGTPLGPDSHSSQALITPRLDKEGTLTLQMTPPHSTRVDADGDALPTVSIVHPVSSGTTFVLANPLPPAAGEADRYLLIFITPTAITTPAQATPPQIIP